MHDDIIGALTPNFVTVPGNTLERSAAARTATAAVIHRLVQHIRAAMRIGYSHLR